MRRSKRLVSIAMTAILAASSLVGCSQGGGQTQTTAPAPTKTDSQGQSTALQDAAMDTEGFSYPVSSSETLTYWCELNQNVSANFASLGDTPFAKEWEKETGIKLEFQHPPANQGNEQFSLLLADGNLPDLMEYAWMNYPGGPEKAITDGNILALNDIFDQYCPNIKKYLEENPDIDKMIKTDEGHYYVFPFIRGDKKLCNTIGPMIRKDWLDELNLEVPETIDEWETVLKAFRDQKGASAPFSWEYTMGALTDWNPFMLAYGVTRSFYLADDGTVRFGATEQGYKDYLTLFNRWYAEGLLDPDLATLALDQVSAKITSGDAGASLGWAGSRMGTWINAAIQTDPGFMLAAAPYPTLEKGDYPEFGQIDNQYPNQGCVAITKSCKNVELAARLMDYAYSEEGHMLFNFGIEGESYTMIDGYPTYTDMILNNPDGWSVAQSLSAYVRGNYNGPFVQDIRYLEQYYTIETQKVSNQIWGETNGEKHKIPPITPTADESREYSTIMNEINTYRDEMTLKFIFGTESLDNFDNYVKTIENMGLARALEIQNLAMERYNNR